MTVLLRHQESPMALDRARRREHASYTSEVRSGPPDLRSRRPVFWSNPARQGVETDRGVSPAHLRGIAGATARFERFAPVLAGLFPDVPDGSLRSQLATVPALARLLARIPGDGQLPVKADAELPIARSLFARHEISVGSTGNLGLGIGMMAAALSFRVTVTCRLMQRAGRSVA